MTWKFWKWGPSEPTNYTCSCFRPLRAIASPGPWPTWSDQCFICGGIMRQEIKDKGTTMRMEPALEYAVQIIESYQMDIRNLRLPTGYTMTMGMGGNEVVYEVFKMTDEAKAKEAWADWVPGKMADEVGFCQGRIYTSAVETIKRMASRAATE